MESLKNYWLLSESPMILSGWPKNRTVTFQIKVFPRLPVRLYVVSGGILNTHWFFKVREPQMVSLTVEAKSDRPTEPGKY